VVEEKTLQLRLLDRLGISASLLCAVHCALLPLAMTVLPLLGIGFLAHGSFEIAMIALSITIGVLSLGRSYRIHRRLNPIFMMGAGAILLLFNLLSHQTHDHTLEALHPFIALLGGIMIISAHRVNMKLCRNCTRCEHEHEKG
jgi:hypothetical protein